MNLKEVCRLLLTTDFSNREVAMAADIAPNTAGRYRNRLAEEELDWNSVSGLTDRALEDRLNNGRRMARKPFVEPDFAYVQAELCKAGVTILLLHEEYAAAAGDGAMSETEFRRRLDTYQRSLGIVMRQPHAPGYRLFLDYSGKRPSILDPATGVRTPVELFVSVMGASRKTFVYATATQQLHHWCEANVRAMEFYGGVPRLLVPDNLKAAVDRITAAEGHVINYTYSRLAQHYDCIVMPTRARKPKDKAAVEVGVRFAQRWILARLRNRVFTSIDELNVAIAEMLVRMNDKPMRAHGGKSRNQLFDQLDRPALKSLPELPYEYCDWKLNVTVPQDYHVVYEQHYYSVPYRYIGAKVRISATARQIEVYAKDDNFPIATHLRSSVPGGCSTLAEHQPAAHRAYSQSDGAELIAWADRSGAWISAFVKRHIEANRRPTVSMQAIRSLRTMEIEFGLERLNAACHRAIRISTNSVVSVRSMLERRMESTPLRGDKDDDTPMPGHGNVRGAESYQH
ncbi:IS21 family transposase [Sinimarinibacterium sp. CAU 1509]|uniref:IS21 family transposase n=1 Tax=Sinimarinibacterium sp. CAU 1509 TaxID=2562283 RepID=UPI0010AD38E5|nr:IS21 family transposase [Sinimarinibacterium sp. CAU 1509]TJY61136.1 IS21 family transposase [Sinimarinibacterium sp. CAU 1509]